MATSLALLPTSVNAGVDQGLVAHWTFDDHTATDQSGNGNNGVLSGGPLFVPGVSGLGLELDGVDDFVGVSDSPSLNPTSGLTLAAWYRPVSFAGSGNDPIIDKSFTSHTPPYYQYHLGVTGDQYPNPPSHGNFNFSVAVNGSSDQATSISSGNNTWTAGNWYHIVGTFDGTQLRLYVNGQVVASSNFAGSIPSYGQHVQLGKYDQLNSFLPGTIDDVRIYGRALSETEVFKLATGQTIPTVSSLGLTVLTVAIGYCGIHILRRRARRLVRIGA